MVCDRKQVDDGERKRKNMAEEEERAKLHLAAVFYPQGLTWRLIMNLSLF